jgi:hypothetical protein
MWALLIFLSDHRQLGKKPVVTEEQIEKVAVAVDRRDAKSENGRNIRRMVGR